MAHQSPKKSPDRSLTNRQARGSLSPDHAPNPPSCASCVLVCCLCLAFIIFVVSVAGLTFAKKQFTTLLDPIKDFFGLGPKEIVLSPPSIDEIRTMGRLDTVEMSLSVVVTVKHDYRGPDEKLTYGVCGRIVAGVDLEELTSQDAVINGTTITLSLPQAEVFSVDPTLVWNVAETEEYQIDKRKAQILPVCNYTYSWDEAPFRDKTPELIRNAEEQAIIQFKEIAGEGYLLETAQSNAEKEMARFLMLMGYDEVRLVRP